MLAEDLKVGQDIYFIRNGIINKEKVVEVVTKQSLTSIGEVVTSIDEFTLSSEAVLTDLYDKFSTPEELTKYLLENIK